MIKDTIALKKSFIQELRVLYQSNFGENSSTSYYIVPANIILLGDHTHYNEGIILATSVNRYCGIGIQVNNSDKISAVINNRKFVFPVNEPILSDHRSNWILNCLHQSMITLVKYELLRSGFNIAININIPQSMGISSSAAIFVGLTKAITDIFKLRVSKEKIIDISSESELSVYGKISNKAMHYCSLANGGKSIKFVDLRTARVRNYEFQGNKFDFVLMGTGNSVEKPGELCNDRIEECSIGVKGLRLYIWGIKNLRDVEIKFLDKHINMLPRRIFNRCLYNVKERIRVNDALKEIRKNNFKKFAGYLFDSHDSLSTDYEVSSVELDYLVELCKNIDGIAGAKMISCSPMRSIIMLIDKTRTDSVIKKLSEKFKDKYHRNLEISRLEIENGIEKV